jgi:hypothetical protein
MMEPEKKPSEPTSEEKHKETWHLDKKVSVTHLFASISAIFVIGVFLAKQDTRITLLEQTTIQLIKEDARQDKEKTEMKQLIREDLQGINGKLDKLQETIRRTH